MPDFIFSMAILEVIAQIKIHKLTMSSFADYHQMQVAWSTTEDEDRFLINPINGCSAHNKATNN